MGAWGLGSDENDWTYDAVGLGIDERMDGISLSEQGRSGLVKELLEMDSNVLTNVGVVIWLLKLGCPVPMKALMATRATLVAEKVGSMFPDKIEERKAIVGREIQMIDSALSNNGSVLGPPIGVRGIGFVMASGF
ncbi:MAG: hypothetical protein SGILL_009600 [Bacillariaceae sp.]